MRALLAVTLGGASSAAYAQDSVRPLTITASAEARYRSNAARISPSQAAARGLDASDVQFRPSVTVDLAKPIGPHLVSLTGTAGYDFYAKNTVLNRERLLLDGNAALRLSRCLLNLGVGFSRKQTDLGELAFIPADGESIKNTETNQTYSAQARCGGGIGFAPVASITRGIGTNSSEIRQFSNNTRMQYSVGLAYSQPSLGDISVQGVMEDVSYPNRDLIDSDGDGYTSKGVGVTYQRDIGANLTGTGSITYISLQPRRAGAPDYNGLNWSFNLSATFSDRLQLQALIANDTSPTLQSDAVYQVERRLSLDATYAINSRLSANAGVLFSRRRFPGAGVTTGVAVTRSQRSIYSASLNYELNDRLSFGLLGEHQTRNSDGALFDYDDTSVALRAELSF